MCGLWYAYGFGTRGRLLCIIAQGGPCGRLCPLPINGGAINGGAGCGQNPLGRGGIHCTWGRLNRIRLTSADRRGWSLRWRLAGALRNESKEDSKAFNRS